MPNLHKGYLFYVQKNVNNLDGTTCLLNTFVAYWYLNNLTELKTVKKLDINDPFSYQDYVAGY
jgi:hypothetical protein